MAGSLRSKDSFHEKKTTMTDINKAEHVEQVPNDDEATRKLERQLVRKLDMTLMPVVWVLYFFNYMDRNNIA
jgi:hypothetical protein